MPSKLASSETLVPVEEAPVGGDSGSGSSEWTVLSDNDVVRVPAACSAGSDIQHTRERVDVFVRDKERRASMTRVEHPARAEELPFCCCYSAADGAFVVRRSCYSAANGAAILLQRSFYSSAQELLFCSRAVSVALLLQRARYRAQRPLSSRPSAAE